MNKYIKYFAATVMIILLSGCSVGNNNTDSNQNGQESQKSEQKYLFEAKNMDSIQLTGQEILDGKEATMSVKISDVINMDFHISRDNPNGTKLYVIYNAVGYNFAVNFICPDVFNNDEAIAEYSYQLCCYDFNADGIKEIIVTAGNKVDQLSIFIFRVNVESEQIFFPENYILGFKNCFVNQNNEICVPSPNGEKIYLYNIQAEDAEYAKLSGPIKITVNFATEEQLQKYKTTEKFIKDQGAPNLLILPKETLKNVTLYSIKYDENTNKHQIVNTLYNLSEIGVNAPLIVQILIPDFPNLAVSYTDESGMEQLLGISESLETGLIYLFEMNMSKG